MYYNMYTSIGDIQFEWDLDKERSNIQKHGIDFETAAKVFFDPDRIEYFDVKHSASEERYFTIGMVDEIVFVVYTIRNRNTRIISARLASKEEMEEYLWIKRLN